LDKEEGLKQEKQYKEINEEVKKKATGKDYRKCR